MKRLKKIAGILLAVVMALGMTMTAFAADNTEWIIKVDQNEKDKTEHTYEAYQIFKGNLATVDGKRVLSNIEWGSGVNETALLAALKASDKFEDAAVTDGDAAAKNLFRNCNTAADVAAVVSKFDSSDGQNAKMIDDFATIVGEHLTTPANTVTGAGDVEIKVVGSGYYLVKDKDGSVVSGGDAAGAYTRFLLQVIDDNTVVVKSEVPGGEKKTYEVTQDASNFDPTDANYANIGSHVSYVVTSNVPNYTGYDYYFFVMNDTLSKGLTFDGASSVAVSVGGQELTQGDPADPKEEDDYYVYTGTDAAPYTFRLAFADIMREEIGAAITVTYSATVNDEAEIGTTGNPNTWTLQYSNNPNENYDGRKDENRPGLPLDEENGPFGETPEDKTLTFLTELDLTKYKDEAGIEENLLAGAEFTLTGTSYQVVLKDVVYYEKADNGTWYLLKDGTYTETAPTGTSYVEIGVGTSETTTGYLRRVVEEGQYEYYVPVDAKDYVGATLYKLVRGTNEDYVDVNTKYVAKTETTTTLKPVQVSMELTTGADGKISFKGLGAGEYTLTETVTPAGYNTIAPMKFTIGFKAPASVADGTEACEWTFTGLNGFNVTTVNGATGAADIVNVSGTLLPSTGGIGTTIFYVVGGILILAAAVLLIVKKRMSVEK